MPGMAIPISKSGQQIPPAVLEAAREMIDPVRRSGDAAVKRLQRRVQHDPALRDIPVEILTAAVLDLLTPTLREAVISGLLEDAQEQVGRIRARELMGSLTGATRQNVEQKFGLIKPPARRKPVPGPRTGAEPAGSTL
jgi:hypothetical protein